MVIGAGLMGTWHAHALGRLGIPVSGIVDPDRERADKLARATGGCPVFGSVEEAIERGCFRAAHVCTPLSSHVPIISALLGAGVHVLAEKPIAQSSEDTKWLLDLAEHSNRMLCPVHQLLFQPGFVKTLAELTRTRTVLHVDAVACSAGASGDGSQRQDEVAADILPHPLSLMRRLVGSDFALAEWTATHNTPGEIRATAACGGTTLGILVSMNGRPTRNSLRIVCCDATYHLDLFHGFAVRESPEVSRVRKVLRPFALGTSFTLTAGLNLIRRGVAREPAYPGLRALISRFYEAESGKSEPPLSNAEVMDVAIARDGLLMVC